MNFMRGKTREDEKCALFDFVECNYAGGGVGLSENLAWYRMAGHKIDLNPVVDFPDCSIIDVPLAAAVEYSSIMHTDRIFRTLSKKNLKKSKA